MPLDDNLNGRCCCGGRRKDCHSPKHRLEQWLCRWRKDHIPGMYDCFLGKREKYKNQESSGWVKGGTGEGKMDELTKMMNGLVSEWMNGYLDR